MTVTETERQRIVDEVKAQQRKTLVEKMRKMGRSRSPAKRAAARRNAKIAQAVRHGKKYPGMRKRKS
jgi:predicted DNA-binding protein (UPF0251 family)